MQIRITTKDERAIVFVAGSLGTKAYSVFREACDAQLRSPGVALLEIDLSGVSYCNSQALGMLMLAREHAQKAGKSLLLSNPNQMVRNALELANFQKIFQIV